MKLIYGLLRQPLGLMAAGIVFGMVASTQSGLAWTYVITNENSSVTVQADAEYGMSDWTVDGQTQLFRQWFWYRSGSGGKENPINSLDLKTATLTSPSTLTTLYQNQNNAKFSVEVSYSLLGGVAGSGSSSIGEQIKITNLTGTALDFHFFQYVDFDLGGSHLGDTVTLEQNLQGLFEKAFQTKGNAYFADEIVSPAANHGEVGLSESILYKLKDNSPTTLNDTTGPVTGDAIWGFQWDVSLAAHQSFDIAINKSVYVAAIPEPTSAALFAVGAVALGICSRRYRLK